MSEREQFIKEHIEANRGRAGLLAARADAERAWRRQLLDAAKSCQEVSPRWRHLVQSLLEELV